MDQTSKENTALKYVYRDASNYKWFETIIVEGRLEYEDLRKYLIDGEFFVPEAVGLKSLTPEVRNEDDHDWHTIFSLTTTDQPAGSVSAATLIDRFQAQHKQNWSYA